MSQIIDRASGAFQQWRRLGCGERVARLAPLAERLRERQEEAAELMCREMGKPLAQGRAEVLKCAHLVEWYTRHAAELLRDAEYPALPGFRRSFVSYQPLGAV